MNTAPLSLPRALVVTIAFAAVVNTLIGLMFLLGPELGFTLWPTPLPREITRFIGAIVIANGVGAGMIARNPAWENARVLIAVALVYGILVFLGLILDLLFAGAPVVFWAYLIVDTLFLIPIGYCFWKYENAK